MSTLESSPDRVRRDHDGSVDGVSRILLIEDNGLYVELVRDMLVDPKGKSYALESADLLAAGLERLAQSDIDLILLDLSLPDSNGLETFARVHACASQIPIIVLTGLADENIAIQTVRDGAQDYLVKTEVSIRGLVHAINYAIERSRLNGKLSRMTQDLLARKEEMEADLEMAQELQQVFLSHKRDVFPETAGERGFALRFHYRYQPTAMLAGDFFDVMKLSETMIGILIADVMGHGVRAALVTAIVRGLVEDPGVAAVDPGQFLTRINRRLTGILCHNEWPIPVSAFYLVADIANGRILYSNAAHPHPIYLHHESGCAQYLVSESTLCHHSAPILGVIGDAVYSTSECQIAPRDRIVLYTDGLYEAEGRDSEPFGRERLMAAISQQINRPASELLDAVLDDVRHFTGSPDFSDDVCMVGIEIIERPPCSPEEATVLG